MRGAGAFFRRRTAGLGLAAFWTRDTLSCGCCHDCTLDTVDNYGNGVDTRPYRQSRAPVERRSLDGRDRPPPRHHQDGRRRQGAPPFAGATALAAQGAAEATGGHRFLRSELLVADRPSRREAFPFLRRAPARRKALLRPARCDRLYSAEEIERCLRAEAAVAPTASAAASTCRDLRASAPTCGPPEAAGSSRSCRSRSSSAPAPG